MANLKALRKAISVLLILILVPLLLGQLAAQAAGSLLSDPAAIKEVLRESGLEAEAERQLAGLIAADLNDPASGVTFTGEEVQSLLQEVLPTSRVQVYADMMIDGMHAWFIGGSDRPEIQLDLSPIRNALPGAVRRLVAAKLEQLPVCTAAQAATLARSYQGGMPPCKSADAAQNSAMVERAIPVAQLQEWIPAHLNVGAMLEDEAGPGFWAEMAIPMQAARSGLRLIPVGWVIIGLLLAALAALNLDHWYTPFAWTGSVLLVAGGGMWLISMLALEAVPIIFSPGSGYEDSVELVAGRLGPAILGGLVRMSLTAALVGLGCIIVAVAGRIAQKESAPANSQAAS